jgi:hypothetical protein
MPATPQELVTVHDETRADLANQSAICAEHGLSYITDGKGIEDPTCPVLETGDYERCPRLGELLTKVTVAEDRVTEQR